jgi:hypothetical protein
MQLTSEFALGGTITAFRFEVNVIAPLEFASIPLYPLKEVGGGPTIGGI